MTDSHKPHDQTGTTKESPHLGSGGETGTMGAAGTPEPSCWLATACLSLLCAALFLGITSLAIHYHKSSVKSTLLSVELRGSQEAQALLQRENEALLASQAALHTQCHQCSQAAAAAREQPTQRDVLALLLRLQEGHCAQLLQANQQLHGDLVELRASTARLHSSAHSRLQEAVGRLEAERANLTEAMAQLQGDRHELAGRVERLQRAHAELSGARARLLAENVRLSEGRVLLAQQHAALERERDRLRSTLIQLGHLPAVEHHCPTDPGTEERVCMPCLRGWRLFSTHCYFFSTELRSWSSSRMHCLQQGGDLVVIDSMEEQEYLHRQTPQYRSPEYRYWIGLSDAETEGVWVWVDKNPMQNSFWTSGSGGEDTDKDCVSILKETNPAKNWRHDDCSKMFRWICESPALLEKA